MSDNIDYLPVAYADARVAAEVDVLGAILAEPESQYRIARDAGLRLWHFDSPDLRTIFCAVGVDHARGIEAVLRLAKIGLRHDGWWDDLVRVERLGFSIRWSDDTLGRLPALMVEPDATRWAAERLIDIDRRAEAATAAYMACLKLVANGRGADHE